MKKKVFVASVVFLIAAIVFALVFLKPKKIQEENGAGNSEVSVVAPSQNETQVDINFREACNRGMIAACYNLGFRKKLAGQIEEAKNLFKHSCEKGHELSCNMLNTIK